ncbi:Arginine--pyruvate transaminase AruH [compost metagenome]|jgi:arginine:pyruvate transaminase|uniref:Arginine--pyruvate transaminase AruH n=1 Tax=Pseudomonas fluorescens TaxID=294 RepID=A0A5E7QYI3_PSEFL|nr:Arginine--pyruvate transaminase AruH [Pseudomonas fluorescens]
MLVQALLDLGDEVIGTCGAKVVPVAERLENSFQVASVDVVALVTPQISAILLKSPNNAFGANFPLKVWLGLASL